MNKHLSAAVKNYIVCGALMVIVGISLLIIGKSSFGVGCIIFGILFFAGAAGIIASGKGFVYTYDKEDEGSEEKEAKSKKGSSDKENK